MTGYLNGVDIDIERPSLTDRKLGGLRRDDMPSSKMLKLPEAFEICVVEKSGR